MGSREVIIEVNDVHKAFRVYYDKGSMLKERVVNPGRSHYELREVLNGVSYKIYRGETVALIGENGCGKSTTLKLLTKILYPNSGTVQVGGKVSSLIELGAGFHPDMSGRENIYINASILGVPEREVDRRIDEIIRFSELEEFIDNPVRTYSSGMYMRLAFSVAINVDADILLIDEILAVGDQAFQEKCINKLNELRAGGVTVVLVSHSMGQIKEIADRCIWIEAGRVIMDGDTDKVCDAYEAEMERKRLARDLREEEERQHTAADTVSDVQEQRSVAKENIYTLSGIRLAGMLGMALVILLAAVQDIYWIGYDGEFSMTLRQQIAGFTYLGIGRTGEAVLLLYAGFVLMKEFEGRIKLSSCIRYWKKYFIRLLLIWEAAILLYSLFDCWYTGSAFLPVRWLRRACFLETTGMSNEWLMRSLLLLVLAAPFLVTFIRSFDGSALRIAGVLVWVFFFLFPGLDMVGRANGGPVSIPYRTNEAACVFYFCLGYYLSQECKSLFPRKKELLLIILAVTGTALMQIFLYARGVDYLMLCTHFLVSIGAVLIFDFCNWTAVTLRRLGMNRVVKWLEPAARQLVVVFILYRPVCLALKGVIQKQHFLMMWVQVIVLWMATAGICLAIAGVSAYIRNKA